MHGDVAVVVGGFVAATDGARIYRHNRLTALKFVCSLYCLLAVRTFGLLFRLVFLLLLSFLLCLDRVQQFLSFPSSAFIPFHIICAKTLRVKRMHFNHLLQRWEAIVINVFHFVIFRLRALISWCKLL